MGERRRTLWDANSFAKRVVKEGASRDMRRADMRKRILALVLAALVLSLICVPATPAQQPAVQGDKRIEKLRKEISKLKRSSADNPITVKLVDGSKVKGYIAEVLADYFVLTDGAGHHATRVEYSQIEDVKKGLGTNAKVALGISGAILGILAICVLSRRCEE